jgi:thiamine-phosphate pyrophosphorylase
MSIDFSKVSVYLVTDPALSNGRSELEIVRAAAAGGIRLFQYRDKPAGKRVYLEKARVLADLCRELGVDLILNDHVDIAALVDCAGIHLGQDDLPTRDARQLLGPSKAIGRSTHDLAQAQAAIAEGADYINIGPVFATNTKNTPVRPVGLDMVREIARVSTIPVTTMGGIGTDNVAAVVAAGADRVAVVTAITQANDVERAARALVESVESAKVARSR